MTMTRMKGCEHSLISCGAVIQLPTRVEIIAEEEPVHNLHHHHNQDNDDGLADDEGDDDKDDNNHVDCDICDHEDISYHYSLIEDLGMVYGHSLSSGM